MTTVSSGQVVSNLTVSQGNPLTVLGGGLAVSVSISGSEFVSAGGTDLHAMVQSAGQQTVTGTSAVAAGATIGSAGTQFGGGGITSLT